MSTQKLFRETAFNGYNRDDVREYIKKQDERIRELETSLADSEAIRASEQQEAQAEIEKLNGIIESLNGVLDEKNKENLELTEQVMQLKNALLEQANALQEKVNAIELLRKELDDVNAMYSELRANSDKQSEKIAEQSERLSALDDKNKQVEDDLRTYIERSEKLKNEAEGDLLAGSKLRELEATIAQKDERIKFLEDNWNQHKADYNVYTEVKNNVENILSGANKKADETLKNASMKPNKCLTLLQKKEKKQCLTCKRSYLILNLQYRI